MKDTETETFMVPKKKKEITKRDIPNYGKIKQLILYEGLQTIGIGTFALQKIETLKLPTTLQKIGISAFYSNPLKELILNEGLTWIGADAFRDCELKIVTIPKTVTHIGSNAFKDNPLEKVIIDHYSQIGLLYEEELYDIFGTNVIIEKKDLHTLKKKI